MSHFDLMLRVFTRKEKAQPQCSINAGLLASSRACAEVGQSSCGMKRTTFVIGIISIATLSLLPTRAGLIAIMRGEPESLTPHQRVAFVGSATVKRVEGQVERLCGIDCWTPLFAETHLKTGDIVRSAKGSVVLQMDESQSFVKVAQDTILRLIPLDKKWDPAVLTGVEEHTGFAVRSCRGSALYQVKGGDWRRVQVNTVLPDSAVLRTEPGTVVDLYCTTARKPVRVEGQKETRLAALVQPHSSGTGLAALTR